MTTATKAKARGKEAQRLTRRGTIIARLPYFLKRYVVAISDSPKPTLCGIASGRMNVSPRSAICASVAQTTEWIVSACSEVCVLTANVPHSQTIRVLERESSEITTPDDSDRALSAALPPPEEADSQDT